MKKILTADNTETFLNEEVGESYHSYTGAVEEALKKYAIPCKIVEKAKLGKIRILDVCFGMGYNSAMAIDIALQENPHCEIEVVGLEYDTEIIGKIQEVNPPITFFTHYKRLNKGNVAFKEGNVQVKLNLEMHKKLRKNFMVSLMLYFMTHFLQKHILICGLKNYL
jgi:hypothetical protein